MAGTPITQPGEQTKRRKRADNPAGSTNALREDVLKVLGVVKVATADQIQRTAAPHLTYRHTTKPTAAKRKEARTAAHRGALADLRASGQVLFGGHTRTGEGLRLLTQLGLDSATGPLGRPKNQMGGAARGAGRSGAQHAMSVNETILALLRPTPDLSLLEGEPPEAMGAARAAAAQPGLGSLGSYVTEVHLPYTGTWSTQGRSGVQADIVVAVPDGRVPLLFVEVDNCFEEAAVLAAKFDKYARFFARQITDTDGQDIPMWRQKWTAPEGRLGDTPHPPVLLVFNPVGPRNPKATMQQIAARTRRHWQGEEHDDFSMYDRCIPIVATTLERLREHGPAGPAFWRFGRPGLQPLDDAVGNPRREAADARVRAERQRARAAAERREAAEREARRPKCTRCGTKFTDQRWAESEEDAWGTPMDSHPKLCGDCKLLALEKERERKAAKKEAARLRREAAKAAQEAAEAEAARKANRILGRFRP
ncbi:replication-relaxation family protein [Streptomyces sp. NPDC088197]|uniref:replication-relaxation family protein n=1 Tax=Streptomyces sp. NPDC088197 TaxID=3365840 RepID=UPI00380AFA89